MTASATTGIARLNINSVKVNQSRMQLSTVQLYIFQVCVRDLNVKFAVELAVCDL